MKENLQRIPLPLEKNPRCTSFAWFGVGGSGLARVAALNSHATAGGASVGLRQSPCSDVLELRSSFSWFVSSIHSFTLILCLSVWHCVVCRRLCPSLRYQWILRDTPIELLISPRPIDEFQWIQCCVKSPQIDPNRVNRNRGLNSPAGKIAAKFYRWVPIIQNSATIDWVETRKKGTTATNQITSVLHPIRDWVLPLEGRRGHVPKVTAAQFRNAHSLIESLIILKLA